MSRSTRTGTLLLPAAIFLAGCQASFRSSMDDEPLCDTRTGAGSIGCPPATAEGGAPGPDETSVRRPGPDVGQADAAAADLYSLRERQNEFHRKHREYAKFLDDRELGFEPSPDVRVQLVSATANGWSAIARVRNGARECAIYEGSARRPRDYVSERGVVACRG